MVSGLGHTGIVVQDMDRMVRFYTEDLGLKVLLELIHYIDPPAGEGHFHQHLLGAMHICFNVDNLAQTHATLGAKGVRFVTEPKYKDADGNRIGVVYARDPEGNWLEFIEGW